MKSVTQIRRWAVGAVLIALASPAGMIAQPRTAAQPLDSPHVGVMIDAHGALRTVSGVAGNFLTGPARARGVRAMACAEQLCAAIADSDLEFLPADQKGAGPRGVAFQPTMGPTVLATDGERVVTYSAQTGPSKTGAGTQGEFLQWNPSGRAASPEPLGWNIGDRNTGDRNIGDGNPGDADVLSIRLTSAGGEIAVRRDGAVWIVSQDGAALDTLPAETGGPVLLIDGGAVYGTQDSVVLWRRDGTAIRFPVSGVQAFYPMASDWVEVATGEGVYTLRTTAGREGWYMLPGGAQ